MQAYAPLRLIRAQALPCSSSSLTQIVAAKCGNDYADPLQSVDLFACDSLLGLMVVFRPLQYRPSSRLARALGSARTAAEAASPRQLN